VQLTAVPNAIRVKDAGELAGLGEPLEVPITDQFEPMLAFAQERQPRRWDFTYPSTVYDNIRSAIAYGIRPVTAPLG